MNINCPGCGYDYKIDENRIPAGGHKMRCPQCGSSFRVTPEGIQPGSHVPSGPSSNADAKKTMPLTSQVPAFASLDEPGGLDDPFGVGDAQDSWSNSQQPADPFSESGADLPTPANDDPFATTGADLPTPANDDPFATTGADLPTPANDDPFAADIADLPSPANDDPFATDIADLPSPAAELPAPAGGDPFSASGADLPTPAAELPTPAAELPTPAAELPTPADDDPFAVTSTDLPALSGTDLPNMGASNATIDADDDPFGLPSVPADHPGAAVDADPFSVSPDVPNDSFAESATMMSPGGPSGPADDPFTQGLPSPANFSEDSRETMAPEEMPDNDPFDLPSPADFDNDDSTIMGHSQPSPSSNSSSSSSNENYGNLDMSGDITDDDEDAFRVSGAGTTDFGEISLGGNNSDDDENEFDAFPVQEEEEEEGARQKPSPFDDDLDIDGSVDRSSFDDSANPFAAVDNDSNASTEQTDADKKIAGAFDGRKKYERQKRRSKVIVLVALLLFMAAGGALHFTEMGAFGVNALVNLLPKATSDDITTQHFATVAEMLEKDTYAELNNALSENKIIRSNMPQDEDLKIISAFLLDWQQIRFGLSESIEKEILVLIGNINLNASQSRYKFLLESTRAIVAEDYKKAISQLSAINPKSNNVRALLAVAQIRSGQPKKALAPLTGKLSPRLNYLKMQALNAANNPKEAIKGLELMTQRSPSHWGAKILLASIMVENRSEDDEKVAALLTPVSEAPKNSATKVQKALVHSIVGKLMIRKRDYKTAESEFKKAEKINPNDPVMLIGKGRIALISGAISKAMTYFRNAQNIAPHNINATLGIAEVMIHRDKMDESLELVKKVLAENPQNPQAHFLRGEVLYKQAMPDEADKSYRKATELDPKHIEAYVAIAELYIDQDKSKEAMKTLDIANAAVPNSSIIKLTLADGHATNKDYDSAIITLDEALAIEPDNPVIHFKMAKMYRKQQLYQDAQNALDEVARLNPSYPGLSVEQGYLLELSGKIEDALARYEKALEENPDDIIVKTRVAAASVYQHKFNRAKELLVEVLNENPESPDGNFYMGEVFRQEHSGADAIPYLKNATSLDPDNPIYAVRYGAVLVMMRKFTEAMVQYDKAKKLAPEMPETYVRIGEMLLKSGSAKDSIEQFERALQLDEKRQGPRIFIGQAYEELGDHLTAEKYYADAVQTFPGNAEAWYRMGLMYLQTKGNKKAIRPLEKSVNLSKHEEITPPWLMDACYLLGKAQKAAGSERAAIKTFEKYLELAPEEALDRSEVSAILNDLKH